MTKIKAILKAIEVDFVEDTNDKDFVKKILESKQEIKESKTVKVALEDLWKQSLPKRRNLIWFTGKSGNKIINRKISELLEDLKVHPFEGVGKQKL